MKRPSLSFATFARSSFAILAIFACLAALAAPPPLAAQTQPAAHTDDPAPQQPPAAPKPDAPIAPMGNLNLQGVALSEVVNTLARYLKLNIIDDASLATVKNGVTLNTYGDPKDLDARNLLDQILRINGLAITEAGGLYHIVQLKDLSHQPLRPQIANAQNIVDDDQPMLNLIFLKYVTVDTLLTILNEFAGDNALIKAYPPANLLFVLDSRRNMRRLMELIGLFDNDSFANQRVRLFEVKNARPSDIVKELDNVLKSISLDSKSSTVKFLPIDRINTLIAVAPNAGVFDTVEEWLRKLDVAVKISAGAIDNYVYPVRYGRADCLAISLGQLFGTPVGNIGGGGGGYGNPGGYGAGGYGANGYAGNTGYGGSYGSPYGGGSFGGGAYGGGSTFGGGGYGNPGGYGNANNFSSGFGGAGACASYGSFGGGGSPIYGYGGYSAQTPAGNPIGATGQTLAAAGAPGSPVGVPGAAVPGQVFTGSDSPRPPRIVANPLDNKLLIQADAQQYQNIVRVLKDLDVPPRQILLEAKIYEVDLTDQFSSGINYTLGPRTSTQGQVGLTAAGVASLTLGGLVANGRELLATLTLNENVNKVHMVSEPSLIATDSIPASINVGTQVPVSTGSTTIPTGSGVAVSQNISSENTGVTLQVNARVNPSGIVTLIVNQEISGIAGGVSTGLSTPAFSQQIVQTQITVQDGDTIAIGGTISDSVTDMVNGIPVLIHIPWLGALFGSKSRVHSRTEMIIFMTPHVIYDETNLIEASDELKNRVKYLRKYLRGL